MMGRDRQVRWLALVFIILFTTAGLYCTKKGTVGDDGSYREGKVVEGELRERNHMSSGYAYGFRVQIYATRDVEKARRVAESAKSLFGEQTYIEFQEPLYKVRLGDYRRREGAKIMRHRVASSGFEDAWIIQTTIRTRNTDGEGGKH